MQMEDLFLILNLIFKYGWLVITACHLSDLLINVGNIFAFVIVDPLQKQELALLCQRSRCPLSSTFFKKF